MNKRALHKVSSFIDRNKNTISLSIVFDKGSPESKAMERAIFISGVEYEHNLKTKRFMDMFLIKFTTYNQLKNLIPIINKNLNERVLGREFFVIDDKCERLFNEK